MKQLLGSLALLVALLSPAYSQEGPEPTAADKAFFREFKQAALAGDRAWINAHICFPVRATIDGRTRMIANAAEFDAAYAQLMTLDALNELRRQTPETLVRTRQGVMVGDGAIWFDENPAGTSDSAPKQCIIAFGNSG